MEEDDLYRMVEDDEVTLEDFKDYVIPNSGQHQKVKEETDKKEEILLPGNQSLVCSTCSEIFSTASLLKDHLNLPTSFCADCLILCCGQSHLARHMQECGEKRRMETLALLALECRQVMVDNKEALEERLDAINMETEGVTYKGELRGELIRCTSEGCGVFFTSSEEEEESAWWKMKEHRRTMHEKTLPIISCGFGCGKVFEDRSSLANHRLNKHPELEQFLPVDLGSGELACPVCDQSFKLRNTCSVHIKVKHLGWSPKNALNNKCQQCDKTFTGPKLLRSHEEFKHKGNKSVCKICSKEVASLRHHMDSVHVQRSLACQHCGKYFKRSADLKRHNVLVHLKVRNHACDICGKRFGEKKDMTRHKECVHFGKKLPWANKKPQPQQMVQMVLEDGSTVVIPMVMEYVEQNQGMRMDEERMGEPVLSDMSYLQMNVKEEEAINVFVMD